MKITWALIVQRRGEHARARERDDAFLRPVANRLRDFLETYLDAPPGTVSMRLTSTGDQQGTVDLSFAGEEAGVAVTLRHDGAGLVEVMVDRDEWFDVSTPQRKTASFDTVCERIASMVLRPEVARLTQPPPTS